MTSVYIHIPFCNTICTYCDFCKFLYNKNWIDKYLIELEHEIKNNYKGELLKTIYIGGGTPSILSLNELKKLFSIINNFKIAEDHEFTFECNIESLNEEKLKFLFNNNVNRLSIGIQTFNDENLKFLNRKHNKNDIFTKIEMAKRIGFNNINIDLIYALPNEKLIDLENDITAFLNLNINHISTYSLIIEPHTKLYIDNIKNIDEDLDYEMYKLICDKMKKNNYIHYEISNFAKKGFESRHNLTYWNNKEYYGFGVGASGYIDGVRYDNTRNIQKYLNGEWLENSHKLSLNEKIENEFILGLRKIKGININDFYDKYNLDILKIEVIKNLIKCNKLILKNNNLFINSDYIYIQNEILIDLIGVDYEGKINCN